ncbi:MAG TPA: S8 family serine peptidase, partial [Candidatus Thalassarchaeaceae archaeon]|nr:S8 family serine peptidase [Candidatus Thalassarchaeaceae archaeon]
MLTSTISAGLSSAEFSEDYPTPQTTFDESYDLLPQEAVFSTFEPWVEPSIWQRIENGQESLRVTVITHSIRELGLWQFEHEQLETQEKAQSGERLIATDPSDGEIDHRTFWIDSNIFHKLPGVAGIIGILDAQNSPEPFDITPLDSPDFEPSSVRSGEIHGAIDSWERGYAGEGIIVAVADTGVDFAHPDLDGTQARITDGKQYDGWPMMFDHNSMWYWLVQGETYPSANTWYADTSALDWDNDSNGVLDVSGHNITGIPSSISGIYHLGQHPDGTLRSQMGGDVPIIVVDSTVSGVYDMVIPDVNRNSHFGDDENMTKGNETAGLDENDDGIRDVSAGLLYWISDGINGVPYSETYAARHGYSNRIAGSGNLTLFMLDSGSHGTLCASAVAAQAQVSGGSVLGMAPNATIASVGNHYSGGHSLDGWRWIAEGNDGNPDTWDDQPNIGSFSFGYSSIDDSGADSYSLYLDWLTRVYNNQTQYAVAIGNGGHGYGTVAVPGAAQGIFSVGAFSSRTNSLWGQSAPWNNRGPNVVGRMDPDIVAVGWSATGDIPLNHRNDGNSATTTWGGTSLATPITAGLLAVVEQAWLSNRGDYPNSQYFRDFVLATADDRGYDPFVQ